MYRLLILAVIVALPGCATIVNGSSQSVNLETTPEGALCHVTRKGEVLADVATTPGSIHIDKSKNDLMVTCSKEGYQTATVAETPSFGAATFGNILAGGIVGGVVDAASGANYTYPSNIIVPLASVIPAPAPVVNANPVSPGS